MSREDASRAGYRALVERYNEVQVSGRDFWIFLDLLWDELDLYLRHQPLALALKLKGPQVLESLLPVKALTLRAALLTSLLGAGRHGSFSRPGLWDAL